MSYHFLMDLALILLSTKILGLVAQKFQMPQVVGALIAGLILSPAGLGLLSETEFTAPAQRAWRYRVDVLCRYGNGHQGAEKQRQGGLHGCRSRCGRAVPYGYGACLGRR